MSMICNNFSTKVVIFTFLLLLRGVVAPCDHRNEDSDISVRILGGETATSNEFPYMVTIIRNGKHDCGGAIIHETHVLTAAHCIHPEDEYLLRVGTKFWSDGGDDHNASAMMVHPSYMVPHEKNFDFALIKVEPPFHYTAAVQPVALPRQGAAVREGTRAVVSGWGVTALNPVQYPLSLHFVELRTISNEECDRIYPGEISQDMLCAGYEEGGRDSCFGDSGGPLVADGVLIGVVSWGPDNMCASADEPYGVYANVAHVRRWIDAIVAA